MHRLQAGRRPTVVQAMLMGSVVAVIVAMLLLLLVRFLDTPFHPGVGGLRPVAMERTLVLLDQELREANQNQPLPCDAGGSRP